MVLQRLKLGFQPGEAGFGIGHDVSLVCSQHPTFRADD
jgi:hypothetical protein